MTGYEAYGISVADFNKMKAGGKLSLRNNEYLKEKDGDIYYTSSKGTYKLSVLTKAEQTEIMLKIKQIYLFETNSKRKNKY
jgi:hypothetical protein